MLPRVSTAPQASRSQRPHGQKCPGARGGDGLVQEPRFNSSPASTPRDPRDCTSTCSAERSSETATANNRQCLDQDTRQRQETKGMNETGHPPGTAAGQGRAGQTTQDSWTHIQNTVVSTAQASLLPLNSFQKDLPAARGEQGSTVFGNKNRKGRIETRRPEMAFPSA